MIIWINGPFGVGKTRLAIELHAQLSDSFIFDPEEVGFMLRKLTPPSERLADFQDYPLWRELVTKLLVYSSKSVKHLIVPMTVVNSEYWTEIMGTLKQQNIVVKTIVLTAAKETLIKRLSQRGDEADSWPVQQIDRCLEGLKQIKAPELSTDALTTSELVQRIARLLRLPLLSA
jgi:deoxyadenosine/deoxycytidine kinase